MDKEFWLGKNVLVTGHTGFKGAWLSFFLRELGACVHGLALPPATVPNLYTMINSEIFDSEEFLDLRDKASITKFINGVNPQVIFHLAAQASVLEGYEDPEGTWTSNVVGTLNILESLSLAKKPVALVIATTDKVYLNQNQAVDFTESDRLGGSDPYSSSKVAVEELVISYRKIFSVRETNVKIAVTRAGNVIGGGDFLPNRIIPDAFRALASDSVLTLRNPDSTRPWQHVLDPINGYLSLAQHLYSSDNKEFEGAFNFSNPTNIGISVKELLGYISAENDLRLEVNQNAPKYPEAKFLNLNSEKAHVMLGWRPRIDISDATKLTMDWYRHYLRGSEMRTVTRSQIRNFINSEN